jgi:chaperonin GroEL
MGTQEGVKLLSAVAALSANSDIELSDAVMECFELTGDDGNVTIIESTGARKCEVEAIDGFPIGAGYEDSCGPYYAKFVNDPGHQRVFLQKPVFVLYHGRLSEVQTIVFLMETIATMWQAANFPHNVVLVATGFSDQVLSTLALNFIEGSTINVYPLLAPQSPYPNAQYEFLRDLSAITGATIFDPMNLPIDSIGWGEAVQEGEAVDLLHEHLGPGLDYFEAYRYRSNVVGQGDEDLVLVRADELQTQLENPVSELDRILTQERLGKLTGGIAKLKVMGSSNGELKERRDRAEDAISAVRGAIKHGCLPGGGWTLLYVAHQLHRLNDPILQGVLIPALVEPVSRLLWNCGIRTAEEEQQILEPVMKNIHSFDKLGLDPESSELVVYDALNCKHVDPYEGGILDSTPAVLEAIRNSISIATLLGTLGGTVVFKRDYQLEKDEAKATNEFLRNANVNPADERP